MLFQSAAGMLNLPHRDADSSSISARRASRCCLRSSVAGINTRRRSATDADDDTSVAVVVVVVARKERSTQAAPHEAEGTGYKGETGLAKARDDVVRGINTAERRRRAPLVTANAIVCCCCCCFRIDARWIIETGVKKVMERSGEEGGYWFLYEKQLIASVS